MPLAAQTPKQKGTRGVKKKKGTKLKADKAKHTNAASKKRKKEVEVEFDESDPNKPLPIGLKLLCMWREHLYEVNIIDIKEIKEEDKSDPDVVASAVPLVSSDQLEQEEIANPGGHTDLSSHKHLYYIHFCDWDRRMDMWVKRQQLMLPKTYAEVQEQEEEMIKANAKNQTADGNAPNGGKAKKGEGKSKKGGKEGKGPGPSGGNTHGHGHHGSFTEEDIKAHEEATKVKNIDTIILGKYEIHTWYYSPFPPEYFKYPKLFFCEFCLAFFGTPFELQRHELKCTLRHPPGNEIYRSKETNCAVNMFEVDGAREAIYCQNLCYIAKLFLDHKTLEYDCTPFLFYVLCEITDRGCHVVGYFSKEKISLAKYNLACILVLPCHQQKGYGKLLISISYELSKIEDKVGSPEKPISDLGKVSYMSYWSSTLVDILDKQSISAEISIEDLSRVTCMTTQDIMETLKFLKILVWYRGRWTFSLSRMNEVVKTMKKRDLKKRERMAKDTSLIYVAPCRPEFLHWTTYHAKKQRP